MHKKHKSAKVSNVLMISSSNSVGPVNQLQLPPIRDENTSEHTSQLRLEIKQCQLLESDSEDLLTCSSGDDNPFDLSLSPSMMLNS